MSRPLGSCFVSGHFCVLRQGWSFQRSASSFVNRKSYDSDSEISDLEFKVAPAQTGQSIVNAGMHHFTQLTTMHKGNKGLGHQQAGNSESTILNEETRWTEIKGCAVSPGWKMLILMQPLGARWNINSINYNVPRAKYTASMMIFSKKHHIQAQLWDVSFHWYGTFTYLITSF